MEDLRTLPPRRTPVHAGTLLAVQDERLAPSVKQGRATGARIERVRLFDAFSAWAAQAPIFSGAVEFPGAVIGDFLPATSGKYFNGSAAQKWKGAAFEAASVDELAATDFSADTIEPLDGGGAGTSTIGRVDLPWASAVVRFVDLVEPAGGGTSRIRLKAPALPGDVDYTLPSLDGSAGQQLQTDGAGNLSWGGAEGTAVAILAKLLTVDGAGSLLDSDFLDGLSSAGYAAAIHAHAWSDVSKSGSSLADLATRSASDLSSGALAAARGGTNLDTSASTGVPIITAGTWAVQATSGTGNVLRSAAPTIDDQVPSANNTKDIGGANQYRAIYVGRLGLLTTNGLVTTSGGNGALGITAPGTNVLAALAVNVGSAGAIVVNGGALGTPSGGTLTNLTGLPIGSGVSGLGTGVAAALAVNVGSAGAPVTFNGALGTPASGDLAGCTKHKVWLSGYSDGVTCDTTRKYMAVGGYRNGGSIFNTVQRFQMPACTLKEMRFWCQTGPGANTYTVRWNNLTAGTTSSFTVTAGGATTATGLSVAVSAGDRVVWDIVASAGSVADNLSCIFLFEY